MASGAVFFVRPIQSKRYVTLMDPFQRKYSNTKAAVIFIGDVRVACATCY